MPSHWLCVGVQLLPLWPLPPELCLCLKGVLSVCELLLVLLLLYRRTNLFILYLPPFSHSSFPLYSSVCLLPYWCSVLKRKRHGWVPWRREGVICAETMIDAWMEGEHIGAWCYNRRRLATAEPAIWASKLARYRPKGERAILCSQCLSSALHGSVQEKGNCKAGAQYCNILCNKRGLFASSTQDSLET